MEKDSFYYYASASSRQALSDRTSVRKYTPQSSSESTYDKDLDVPLAFGFFDQDGKESDFFTVLLNASLSDS